MVHTGRKRPTLVPKGGQKKPKTEYDEIQDANNTKPADNATVGARLGTNLKAADGSTTLGDADVKNASIASSHVVGGGKPHPTILSNTLTASAEPKNLSKTPPANAYASQRGRLPLKNKRHQHGPFFTILDLSEIRVDDLDIFSIEVFRLTAREPALIHL